MKHFANYVITVARSRHSARCAIDRPRAFLLDTVSHDRSRELTWQLLNANVAGVEGCGCDAHNSRIKADVDRPLNGPCTASPLHLQRRVLGAQDTHGTVQGVVRKRNIYGGIVSHTEFST